MGKGSQWHLDLMPQWERLQTGGSENLSPPDCYRSSPKRPQFPLLRSVGYLPVTSEVPSMLELWLCFLSPATCSKICNSFGEHSGWPVLGALPRKLLCDPITCPPALPEPKERRGSQAMVVY